MRTLLLRDLKMLQSLPKFLLEMNHMYKSYQLKDYDNWLKITAIASIYTSDFIFIYFILKTVKKSLGKLDCFC